MITLRHMGGIWVHCGPKTHVLITQVTIPHGVHDAVTSKPLKCHNTLTQIIQDIQYVRVQIDQHATEPHALLDSIDIIYISIHSNVFPA